MSLSVARRTRSRRPRASSSAAVVRRLATRPAVAVAVLCVAIAGCGSDASTTSASGPRYASATAVAKQADCDYESATPPLVDGRREKWYGACGYDAETVAIFVFDANRAADRAFAAASAAGICRRGSAPTTKRVWFARGPNWFASSADGSQGVHAIAR